MGARVVRGTRYSVYTYKLACQVNQNPHHIHQDKAISHPQTNACLCQSMPYLFTSQHLCINAWTRYMHVHGKTKGLNPKLVYKEQIKQTNIEAETHKHKKRQGRCILYK